MENLFYSSLFNKKSKTQSFCSIITFIFFYSFCLSECYKFSLYSTIFNCKSIILIESIKYNISVCRGLNIVIKIAICFVCFSVSKTKLHFIITKSFLIKFKRTFSLAKSFLIKVHSSCFVSHIFLPLIYYFSIFYFWWAGVDSNHRRRSRRIYSPLHLAALQPTH